MAFETGGIMAVNLASGIWSAACAAPGEAAGATKVFWGPVAKLVAPMTGPIGQHGWTAFAVDAYVLCKAPRFFMNHVSKAMDSWKEDKRQAAKEAGIAALTAGIVAYEVFSLYNTYGSAGGDVEAPELKVEL